MIQALASESAATCRRVGRRRPRALKRLGFDRRVHPAIHRLRLDQAQMLANVGLDLLANIGIVLEKLLGVFSSLADALALVAEPRTALLDHILRHAKIHEVTFARDAFAVNDVEFSL